MTSSGVTSEWEGIGARIRAARKESRISVRELARRMNVSPSHVSQVERGLASFSVRALYNLVNVLDISMDSLFEEGQAPMALPSPVPSELGDGDPLVESLVVQRVETRRSLPLAGGTRWERLTARSETAVEFIEVIYPPNHGEPHPDDLLRHSSREYGVVTHGALTVQVGFDRTVLRAGDSIAFDSAIPHRFWNESPDEVRAVWFIIDSEGGRGASDAVPSDDGGGVTHGR
jgi:transcriptional regulator with XRE-family HTH domain